MTMRREVSYSEMKKKLSRYLDQVCSEHEPLLIRRRNGENVMLLCEDDYRSLEETAYLSQSPENLKRLLNALHRKEGKTLDEVCKDLRI